MSHNFQDSLAIGKEGERVFFQKYSRKLKLLLRDGFKEDFVAGRDREMVELKTDSYDMLSTPNFFMERYSDIDKKKPGGPWQSLAKGIGTFIYYYIKNDVYFLFNTTDLVHRLNDIIGEMKPIRILNRGWITTGYKVPRIALEDLNLNDLHQVSKKSRKTTKNKKS